MTAEPSDHKHFLETVVAALNGPDGSPSAAVDNGPEDPDRTNVGHRPALRPLPTDHAWDAGAPVGCKGGLEVRAAPTVCLAHNRHEVWVHDLQNRIEALVVRRYESLGEPFTNEMICTTPELSVPAPYERRPRKSMRRSYRSIARARSAANRKLPFRIGTSTRCLPA